MISLQKYVEVKDQCCLAYFGPDLDILRELVAARPRLQALLPGLLITICGRADLLAQCPATERLIPSNQLKAFKHSFAYFSEISSDRSTSPIQQLLCDIQSAKTVR